MAENLIPGLLGHPEDGKLVAAPQPSAWKGQGKENEDIA
jgi:hypothetical protein